MHLPDSLSSLKKLPIKFIIGMAALVLATNRHAALPTASLGGGKLRCDFVDSVR
jgi:hypothetical protein